MEDGGWPPDRRVLVSAANKGIGKATVAAILAAADDMMVLHGSRDLGREEAAVADILAAQPAIKGGEIGPKTFVNWPYRVQAAGR